MPKTATKAAHNVFYKARMEAAKCNPAFKSREATAEYIGLDRTRLAYIELGNIYPHPEEALMLAEAYNAPELGNYYCSQVCPLGKKTVNKIEASALEKTVLQLLAVFQTLPEIKTELISIAAKGTIDNDECVRMEAIIKNLDKAADSIQALKIFFVKQCGSHRTKRK